MYTLKVRNQYSEILELTHNEAYVITDITGLNPADAVINTTRNAGTDGSNFNGAYVDNRSIIITMAINSPAEDNRIKLYKYFKMKSPVRLYYKNSTRDVYIDGYVEHVNITYFDKKQIAQITVLCTNPFFNDVSDNTTEFNAIDSLFEFPFEIVNPIPFSDISIGEEINVRNLGDVATGMEIKIIVSGAVTNPVMYNVQTNEYFKILRTFSTGDVIVINTNKKNKKVQLTSGGVTTSIVGNIASGSTWLQIDPGDNIFQITADVSPENIIAFCKTVTQYEGV